MLSGSPEDPREQRDGGRPGGLGHLCAGEEGGGRDEGRGEGQTLWRCVCYTVLSLIILTTPQVNAKFPSCRTVQIQRFTFGCRQSVMLPVTWKKK